jgi:hypothetical protein
LAPDGSVQDGALSEADGPIDVDASPATLLDGRCVSGAYPRNGVCTCPIEQPDVCEQGCVDLTSDDDNCGTCGHSCEPGATCRVGVCGPRPTTVVAAPAACGKMRLAATSDTLYWTDTAGGRVMKMPAAGGDATPVSGAETTAPTLLELKSGAVFWLDGKTIRRSAGGQVSDVYTSLDSINGLAASDDGATVYFSTGAKIESVPASGGAAPIDVEVQRTGTPAGLAVAGGYLIFALDFVGGVDVIQRSGPLALCWTQDTDTTLDVNCTRLAREAGGAAPTDIMIATHRRPSGSPTTTPSGSAASPLPSQARTATSSARTG